MIEETNHGARAKLGKVLMAVITVVVVPLILLKEGTIDVATGVTAGLLAAASILVIVRWILVHPPAHYALSRTSLSLSTEVGKGKRELEIPLWEITDIVPVREDHHVTSAGEPVVLPLPERALAGIGRLLKRPIAPPDDSGSGKNEIHIYTELYEYGVAIFPSERFAATLMERWRAERDRYARSGSTDHGGADAVSRF